MRYSGYATGRDRYSDWQQDYGYGGHQDGFSYGWGWQGSWGDWQDWTRPWCQDWGRVRGQWNFWKKWLCPDDNTAPVAVDDALTVLEPGGIITGNLLNNDTDDDGDPLTVTRINGIETQVGVPVILPEGRVTVEADGTFTVQAGSDFSFTYTISDGEDTDTATVDVNVVGPIYFFGRTDGVEELWKTKGTPEGTERVLEFEEAGLQRADEFVRFEAGFVFQGFGPDDATEPWFTDGSVEGTYRIADLNISANTLPTNFTVVGDKVFFAGRGLDADGVQAELFVTDGTPEGTIALADAWSNPVPPPPPGSFLAVGDWVYLRLFSDDEGGELWRTDGTPEGTSLVIDLLPGPLSSRAEPLFAIDESVIVRANRDSNGYELWISDGTEDGTIQLADDTSGTARGPGGDAFFFRLDEANTYDLWRSDGTVDGTQLVADLNTNGTGGAFTQLGDVFLFATNYRQSGGFELWSTDGTEDGTEMVTSINSTGDDLGIFALRTFQSFSPVGDGLIFNADDGTHGLEPWFTDGTPDGTDLIKDINPDGDSITQDEPYGYLEGRALFGAETPDEGDELWISDGTPEGTFLLADIRPGPDSSFPDNFIA